MLKRFAVAALGLWVLAGCQGMTEPPPADEKKQAMQQSTEYDHMVTVATTDHRAAE